MSDEMVTWLRAQLDDDERAIARIAAASCHGVESTAEKDYFRFVDRASAELDAKRHILDEHQSGEVQSYYDGTQQRYVMETVCLTCVYTYDDEDAGGNRHQYREHVEWPCLTVQYLAAIYSARPGYREEWRP